MKKNRTICKSMKDLASKCKLIHKTVFPCTILSKDYSNLTEFVTTLCKNYNIPYSAIKSQDDNRSSFIFYCTFKNKFNCKSILVFKRSTTFDSKVQYTFDRSTSILLHSHTLNVHFIKAHRNTATPEQIIAIQEQTRLGVDPGRIRANVDFDGSSNIFYEIRRKILSDGKLENLETLLQNLQEGTDKRIKVRKSPNGELLSVTIVDNEILFSDYSNDVVIVDDTATTNMYDMPMETMIAIDQENHTQLLAYSIIPNKTTTAFENFFDDYLSLGGKAPRFIIVDRLRAQINAISKKFPYAYIAYCLVHIRRDLEQYFKNDPDIIPKFDETKYNPYLSNDYLNLLINKLQNFPANTPGAKCLQSLIAEADRWLPIHLIQHGLNTNWDTSRIEGFFGLLKRNYGHEKGKLADIIKYSNNFCSVLKTQSFATYNKTLSQYPSSPFIPQRDYKYYGRMILEILDHEYSQIGSNLDPFYCVWCHLRFNNSLYALPCRHTMHEGLQIDINTIHKRYLRVNFSNQSASNEIAISVEPTSYPKTRENLLALIEPFASLYGKNKDINDIFDTTIAQLNALKINENPGMPSTIPQQGAEFIHPSRNVGRRKRKKKLCVSCLSIHANYKCPAAVKKEQIARNRREAAWQKFKMNKSKT